MKWPSWVYRLVPYLGRLQAEEDLQDELRLHLELERERQCDASLSAADALRPARREGRRLRKQIRTMCGANPAYRLARHARFFRELAPA